MYALDACVLVYSLIKDQTDDLAKKADHLIESTIKDGESIILLTPIIAEFLGVNDEARIGCFNRLRRSAEIYDLDEPASLVAAQIYRDMKKRGQVPSPKSEKAIVKTDIFIASIVVQKELTLCTNDRGFLEIQKTCSNLKMNLNLKWLSDVDVPPTQILMNLT